MTEDAANGLGVFTLSLDFELIWGTVDTSGPERFRRACEVERDLVIDRLLALLAEYEIPATWCIVGHLFLASCAPVNGTKHPEICRPAHAWSRRDWFAPDPCSSEESDPLFYGSSLIEKIQRCPIRQEIGCHSFSHVIFGDRGCSRDTAITELSECLRLARERDIELRSFAFPRNSVGYLDVLREHGLWCFRGPERVWYERPRIPHVVKRVGHLADVITARQPPVVVAEETEPRLWNVPASMLYFPMHGRRRYIPLSLRVRRAAKGIDRAAAERKIFHLWFHPTNLAEETDRMFAGLRAIFDRVDGLRQNQKIAVAPMRALVPVSVA